MAEPKPRCPVCNSSTGFQPVSAGAHWQLAGSVDWDYKDWEIFYHCVGFALWQIARRRDRPPKTFIPNYQI